MSRTLILDRMEIIGFKSFYGRTLFEFPDGITAVVGPNGCGKSNIGDAISWVLGEQKASSLRSDRMEDIIFNGSEARRPLGMAEVSLRFRNVGFIPGDRSPALPDGGHGQDGSSAGGNGSGAHPGGGNGHGSPGADDAQDLAVPIAGAREIAIEEAAPPPEDSPDGDPAAALPRPRFLLEEIPEELMVTRRLYRSGESEYALNGQRCRLKDIQELLTRSRIGTRLYTTIEQGKIDQILTSKPKERRAILEEAAGILGYKTRRRQAEQKLEAAQANLLRLSDITSEVDKQLGSLKRQAAKARRYRRLMEGLRERRLALARRRLERLDGERRETGEAYERLRDRETAAAADLARAEADLEALRQRLQEAEEASRTRRESIHALDMEIDRIRGRMKSGEELSRDLAGRIGEAAREIEAQQARAVEQEGRRSTLDEAIAVEADRAERSERALREIEGRREERAREIAEREASLSEARLDLVRGMDRLAEDGRSRAALLEQSRAAEDALERVEREMEDSRRALGDLAVAAEDLEARAARAREAREEEEHRRQDLVAAETGAADRLRTLEGRSEELKGREAALEERLASLRDMELKHAGFAEGVAEILGGAAGFRPAGVVGERLVVPRGLDRAVAASLEGLLEAVMVAGADDVSRGVAHLRLKRSGRVSFVPRPQAGAGGNPPEGEPQETTGAGSIPELLHGRRGVIGILGDSVGGLDEAGPAGALLRRTILVEDLASALELSASLHGWIVVTRDGDVVRADGVVVGGEGAVLTHGLLARRAEIEDIAVQIETLRASRFEAEATLSAARQEQIDGRAKIEAALTTLQNAAKTALEQELLAMQKRAERQKVENSLPLLGAEAERLRTLVAGLAKRSARLAEALESSEAERRRKEDAIGGASEEIARRREDLLEVQRQEAGARAAAAAGEEKRAALARERAGVEEGVRELRARIAQRAAERDEWAGRISALRDEAVSLAAERDASLSQRADEAAREEAAVAGIAYDRSLLHAREVTAKEERAGHEAVRHDLQERELQRARLDADLRHLEDTCREDLGSTLEALRAAARPEGQERPLEEETAEVERIKAELESIGPVNLMAIDQHAELEERSNVLTAQKTDLDGSIASLRDTIRRINRESRERFLTAFQAIQAGFQDCFSTLFSGGSAELKLEEGEEDVLEAGIEIAARPPGKRLQSIALLSGGEKALTAVALLFSLFRYRPSPFCVLDEVDAPLDEANIERFTRLLRGLREETQFIVITHNRKSMEAADLLYGVTMEEPGISKILPLRFE